ncbi:MAG: hypothetical protein LBR53_03180 [Deltaproteobacteria bacterium]|nr:hypothetical protein [Deltaproteobacteria bacterium]
MLLFRPDPSGAVEGPESFSRVPEFAPLIFEIGAYFTSYFEDPSRPGWRVRTINEGSAGESSLFLKFKDAEPWPEALELKYREGGRAVSYADSVPFGGDYFQGSRHYGDFLSALTLFLKSLENEEKLGVLRFRPLREGMWEAELPVFHGVRMGPSLLRIFRADPSLWSLRPYSEAENPLWAETPKGVSGWTERLANAALVFTGPQYYGDRSSMSYLERQGVVLQSAIHPHWKGFMTGDPRDPGGKRHRITDLALDDSGDLASYETQTQSFMIVDRQRRIRVKDTSRLSSRLVAGEDKEGFIVVIAVEGSASLHDLGDLLRSLDMGPFIGMDGGLQSQTAVKTENGWKYYFGEYSHNFLGNVHVRRYHPSVPFVMALEPDKKAP